MQAVRGTAECDIQEAPRIILVRKRCRVYGQQNDAFAFEALGLVNRADGAYRRARPRVRATMRDLSQAEVGGVIVAKSCGFPELFLVVDFMSANALCCCLSSSSLRSIFDTPR